MTEKVPLLPLHRMLPEGAQVNPPTLADHLGFCFLFSRNFQKRPFILGYLKFHKHN